MDRRAFLTTVAGSIFAMPLAAEAQDARKKTPHIGILSPPGPMTALDTFRSGLREFGYTEDERAGRLEEATRTRVVTRELRLASR